MAGLRSKHFLIALIFVLSAATLWICFIRADPVLAGDIEKHPGMMDFTEMITDRPEGIGLALSGGGAQGFAQIGVLKVLEENNIPISHISGTSIGAVIGGLYASGYSARDLENIVKNTDWSALFSNSPYRMSQFLTQRQQTEKHILEIRFNGLKPHLPQALTAGHKISEYFYKLTVDSRYSAGADFNRLKIPYRAVTTDLLTGEMVVLSGCDLAEAMRASISVPLAFAPVESGNRLLVDGGLACPIPVDVTRAMGADKVMVINTATQLYPRERLKTALDIVNQATSVMVMEKTNRQLQSADLVIQPDLAAYANTGFDDIEPLIAEGKRAARAMLPQIRELLDSQKHRKEEMWLVSDIRVNSNSIDSIPAASSTDGVPRALLSEFKGHYACEMDLIRLENKLLSEGIYCSTSVDTEINDGGHRLNIHLTPLPVIRTVEFEGNTIFSEQVLENYLNIDIGRRLDVARLRSGIQNIENLYRNSHYPLIEIKSVCYDPRSESLHITLDEGLIARVEYIGNRITKKWAIKRDFPKVVGRPYNSQDIIKGSDRLFSTGLFERVTTDIVAQGGGYYTLQLKMREKYPLAARFGMRYDDEYNLQGFGEFGHYNLLGTGNEFFIRGIMGDREYHLRSEFRADRIYWTMLTYSLYAKTGRRDVDIFIDHRPRQAYTETRNGIGFKFGQQLSRLGTFTLEFRFEDIEEDFGNDIKKDTRIRSIVFRSVVDTKDRQTFPVRGKYHHSYLELANEILGGDEVFSKFYISLESYYPLPWGFNFHPRGALGLSINGLPRAEKFRLGEPDGFLGFYSEEITGDNFFAYYLKLRKAFGRGFYGYVRYDSGRTYSERSEFELSGFKHSIGAGLAMNTPIGALDVSYGYYGEKIDKFYVSFGYDF